MIQFCIAYCGVLAKHNICATKMTGKYVAEATGLEIEQLLPGSQGGVQQIASRIAYNDIDLLLFFRDTSPEGYYNTSDTEVLRMCDIYNIPAATNIATAEVLFRALERGDFDWRNYAN